MDDSYLVARRRLGQFFVTARIANQPGERLWYLTDDDGIRHTSWVRIGSIDNGKAKGIKIVILSFALMIGWNKEDLPMDYATTTSATSAPRCEGSNQRGRYVRDSTAGMIYQCPVCRREFVHNPYWAMSGTSSQPMFFIPVH